MVIVFVSILAYSTQKMYFSVSSGNCLPIILAHESTFLTHSRNYPKINLEKVTIPENVTISLLIFNFNGFIDFWVYHLHIYENMLRNNL